MALRSPLLLTANLLALTASASAQLPPNAFDRADASRGGDGTFAGTGTNDGYAINPGAFVPTPGYTFAVGTFALHDTGPSSPFQRHRGLRGSPAFHQAAAFDPVGPDDALSNANLAIVQ
tara:strand:- start:124 stop:480 length:357 start_codon:yes stop_codon:yes gene_type:complete